MVADLAVEAEESGWDGVFVWDAIWGVNAWISLAAAAVRTTRVTFGVMLTPLSRRRPWEVASEAATLDHLSNGRLVFPVGLGAPETGWANFGEETERRVRAERMDEGLEIVTGLWKGQPFAFEGKHYRIEPLEETMIRPLQQPRIPTWIVGAWPREKSMRRVLKYDGLLAAKMNPGGELTDVKPADVREIKAWVDGRRTATTPFDIITEGELPLGQESEEAREWANAGLTWWQENVWATPHQRAGIDGVRERIRQGPPRT